MSSITTSSIKEMLAENKRELDQVSKKYDVKLSALCEAIGQMSKGGSRASVRKAAEEFKGAAEEYHAFPNLTLADAVAQYLVLGLAEVNDGAEVCSSNAELSDR